MQPLDKAENADRLGLAEKLKRKIEYSEDCLYLNIFVPDGRTSKGEEWSVVIWFHPGDFVVGTPTIWEGSTLAIKQKVIIVTASYRLNIFGFMATQDEKIQGNFGLLDQVAVMSWIQEHIKYFNGSKDDVTLWGHSAGAVSITLHLLSEKSTGLFQRAIIMSGTFLTPNIIKQPMSSNDIAETMGCERSNLISCLEKASADTLLNIAKQYEWGPTLSKEDNENMFIAIEPEKLLLKDEIIVNSVPIMIGYTDTEDIPESEITSESEFINLAKELIMDSNTEDNETCTQEDLLTESLLFYYLPAQPLEDKQVYLKKYLDMITEHKYASVAFQLGKFTSKKSETYMYRFDYKLKTAGIGDTKEYSGVQQQHELPFFWGMPYWSTLSPQITWNSQDKRTSDIIMGLFGNFTKYSKPVEARRTLQWDPLDFNNPHIFIIDKNPNMSDSGSFNYKSLLFWNDYYPRLKRHIKTCCSLHSATKHVFPLKWLLLMVIILQIL